MKIKENVPLFESDFRNDPDYEELREMFMSGECSVFALALSEEQSFSIAGAFYFGKYQGKKNKKGELIHAACVDGSDVIDFMGRRGLSMKEVSLEYFEEALIAGLLDREDCSPDLIYIEVPLDKKIFKKRFVGNSASDIFDIAVKWIRKYPKIYS